jgi:hypothetical protein
MSVDCKGATGFRYLFRMKSRAAWRHMFLNHGVDPNALDDDGRTMRDYVESQILYFSQVPEKKETVELYKEYLAEIIYRFKGRNSEKWLKENPKAGKIDLGNSLLRRWAPEAEHGPR